MDFEAGRDLFTIFTFGEGIVSRRLDVESWAMNEELLLNEVDWGATKYLPPRPQKN